MKKPISENTVNQALRRLGYGGVMTAHGFRSTASSLLNESERWHPDVIEHALAHQDKNSIRRIYNRSSYWTARSEMMQWWSDYLDELRTSALSPDRPPERGPQQAPKQAPKSARLAANDDGPQRTRLINFL